MGDILKIYLINLINDVDNILIISAVIRKYGYQVKSLFSYIVLILTISRTVYVLVFQFLEGIPGLRVITGIILLFMAVRLAFSAQENFDMRSNPHPRKSTAKILFIVLVTDFSICMDSVMVTSELSHNPIFIMTGIFFSVSTVFIVFDFFSEIMTRTSIVQILAGGLIAHIAILDMLKDPITEQPILFLENFLKINIHNWYNMFAVDIALLVIFTGLMNRIKLIRY